MSRLYLCVAVVAVLSLFCQCDGIDDENTQYKKVSILYSAGNNSLSSYLRSDIDDLMSGYAPSNRSKKALLIVQHGPVHDGDYYTPSKVYLLQLVGNKHGNHLDTLKIYPEGTNLCLASTMEGILTDIKKSFKSDSYGMVFSSHATGWIPGGYYNNESQYEWNSASPMMMAPMPQLPEGSYPYSEPDLQNGEPMTKSIGSSIHFVEGHGNVTYEMEIADFANCLPFKLDYLILDACLMGGVEFAYEIRDKVGTVCFSQAEILADGLNYSTLGAHLLEGDTPNVNAVADDYFRQYKEREDSDCSATISVVDCTQLQDLSDVCSALFSKYNAAIDTLDPGTVQGFYRYGHHWFYDLRDILIKAGMSDSEDVSLQNALKKCIAYKSATKGFFCNEVENGDGTTYWIPVKAWGGFLINEYCGLSMYLPSDGGAYLDKHYRTLKWNAASGLVK